MGYVAIGTLTVSVADGEPPRPRWNGGTMPSKKFDAAFLAAVDAFQESMRASGYSGHYGYGASAKPFSEGV